MRYSYLILALFLLVSNLLVAQDFDNYQLLKSTGKIPVDFLIPSSEKYKKESENIDKNSSKTAQKDEERFYLESNFLIDDLLRSARVLFNDPITEYVNKVADELLKNDSEMRQKIRLYAVRSSAVNAFATNQGIIFVNVGLLAQLESEAQLAFILAHEISHVKHGHALNMFLESQKIDRYTKRRDFMRNSSFDDRIVAKNYFSKELETHADNEGLNLFLKSKYSLDDIDGVFDVLQYSYLPFDVVPFPKTFLENEFITLPDEYFLPEEELNGIDGEYEEDEAKSTHPSISKRRAACADLIAKENKTGRSSFVVDNKTAFEKIRDIARFELAYYYLHAFQYQEALYACFVLQQKYPDSKYLKKIIAKSLYGYAKFKNEIKGVKPYSVSYSDDNIASENMSKDAHKDIEGPAQQIYYLLAKLKPNELTVLALRYVWDATESNPKDSELLDMRQDLFYELSYHYEKLSDFSSKSIKEIEDETIATTIQDSLNLIEGKTSSDSTKLSKYDKIKKQKKEQEVVKEEEIEPLDFAKYAFRDILKKEEFKDLFKKAEKEKERLKARADYYSSAEGRAYLRKNNGKKGMTLGIDSLLVYAPYYAKVTDKSGQSNIDHLASEKKQMQLIDILQKNAAIAKLSITMLHTSELQETDSEAFNELRVLSEWMSQQNRFGGNLNMKGFNQASADEIIKKYGTEHLLFTGIVSLKKRKTNWMYWSAVFNLKNGSYRIIKDNYFRVKDSKTMLNSHIFDTMFQIKSKPKK